MIKHSRLLATSCCVQQATLPTQIHEFLFVKKWVKVRMETIRVFPCSSGPIESKSAVTWVVQFKSSSRGKKDGERGRE